MPANYQYIKFPFNNVTTQQSRIVPASTVLILSMGLLILNPSMLTTAQGQMYDKHPKKSSDVNIQKIKCINSNVNVNGIDISQIPQDGSATAANRIKI